MPHPRARPPGQPGSAAAEYLEQVADCRPRRRSMLLLLHLAAAAGVFWSVCAAFGTLVDE
jgi:hypothetical protein